MSLDRRLLRRNPLGSPLGGSPGGAPAWTPLSISSCVLYCTAQSGVTTAGATVSQWNDLKGGLHLTQSSGAARPSHSSSVAGLNNMPAITGDGANDKLVFGGSGSNWRFMHDGTGCTISFVVRTPAAASEGSLLESARVSSGNTGFTFYHQTVGNPIIRVTNSSGTPLWTHSGTSVSTSTSYHYLITHSSSAGYSIRRNGSVIASGSYTGSPDTGDANSIPGVFDATTSIGVFSNWTIADLFLGNAVISAGDISLFEAYEDSRYNL